MPGRRCISKKGPGRGRARGIKRGHDDNRHDADDTPMPMLVTPNAADNSTVGNEEGLVKAVVDQKSGEGGEEKEGEKSEEKGEEKEGKKEEEKGGEKGGEKEGEEGAADDEASDTEEDEDWNKSVRDVEIRLLEEPLGEDERGLDIIELKGEKYVLGVSLQRVTKRCHNLYQSIRRLEGEDAVMNLRGRSRASDFLREKGLLERKFKQRITIVRLDALRALRSHRAERRARNARKRRYDRKQDKGASSMSPRKPSMGPAYDFDDSDDDDDMDTIVIDLSPSPTPSPPPSPSRQPCHEEQKENVAPPINVDNAVACI